MHKLSLLTAGLLVSATLVGCSGREGERPPVAGPHPSAAAVTPSEITGTLFSDNNLKLPAASVLTITLSSVEPGNKATKVLAQKVEKLSGRTFPIHYQLPLDQLIITANSKAILTAAVSNNNKVIMTTQMLQPVTTSSNQKQDLTLVPVTNVAIHSSK